MKKIINIILIILFTSLTYAITIETPLPTIITSFNEPVIISSINATLKDNQNNPFLIENVFISSDNKTVKYRPIDYLPESNYVFSIKAQDIYDNFGLLHTFPFTVNVPPLSIKIITPSFKVSSTIIFDLIIETSLPSECKWSLLEDKLYENMGSSFETLEGINHTILNFDITSLTATSTIHTACKTSYDDSIAYKSFELSVDLTPPIITLISANNVTEEPIETSIEVTTDDKTVCKYSKENIQYSNMSFFLSLNESLFNSYKLSHTHPLDHLSLLDYTINIFHITCKNLAELLSTVSTIEIKVDTTAEATITINNPLQDSYQSTSSIILDISTNKLAVCYFSNTSENIFGGGGTFGGSMGIYNHISNPLFLTQGAHTYYFRCFIDPPEGDLPIESTTFLVDTTPPIMIRVDDSNTVPGMQNLKEFTYYKDRLDVEWNAEDNESGINGYEYSIWNDKGYATDEIIKNWTGMEQEDNENKQECEDDCGDEKTDCRDICLDIQDECDDECSSTREICRTDCEDEDNEEECKTECDTERGVCNTECTDQSGSCDNNCNDEELDCSDDCRANKKLIKHLYLDNNKTYYFKFKAENRAGSWGPEKSSDGITVNTDLISIGTCNNGVKDFDETDLDCGGLCDQCNLNQSCDMDGDCLSNYCNSTKKCDTLIADQTCLDGIKNQDETDIDCGGNCSPCTNGNSCSINSDCLSDNCNPDLRLCIISDTCANNILDIDETDIDCGGNCLPCENTNICLIDSDCASNYCSLKTNTCLDFTLCGNGIIDSGEQCENSTDGKTCTLFGFEGGTLTCGDDCFFNTSSCIGENGTCGDDIINPGEQCEGAKWGKVKGCFDFDDFESGKIDCYDCRLMTNQCSKEVDPKQDTDRDGMPDVCELKYFNHRTREKPNDDPDKDKLTNKEECKLCRGLGTNPKKEDTDGDGYNDNKEVEKGTDPCDSEDYPESSLLLIILAIIVMLLLFGGAGYYVYSRKMVSFSSKPPYILFSKPIPQPPLTLKGPGIIEFIKTPPYIKLNADISFTNKPPFVIIKSTLPPPIQQQPVRPIMRTPIQQQPVRPIMRTSIPKKTRRPITPPRKAPPVGLVLKKRQRRKILDTFKTADKKEKDKNEEDNTEK